MTGPTIDAPDYDPFVWLEDVVGEQATDWADAQTAATVARFGDDAWRADCLALKALLDRPDRIPLITRRGGGLYNFWRDAAKPRGVWRRITIESFRSNTPAWDTLLDLDELAAAEDEDWVWQGATTLAPGHALALVRLSRGGSDAAVLREFDIAGRRFTGGFAMPEAKGHAAWIDRDTVLLSSASGGVTRSGYARTVRLWRRGTEPSDAPVIFETSADNMSVGADYERLDNRVVFIERTGFFDARLSLGGEDGPHRALDLPSDAEVNWSRDWLVVRPRTAWVLGATTHAPDTVLGMALSEFLGGSRDFTVLFTPEARVSVQGVFWAGDRLVISILDALRPVFQLVTPDAWSGERLVGLPPIGTVQAWPLDADAEESDGTLLALVQDPVTPPTLLIIEPSKDGPGLAAPSVLKHTHAAFDATGLVVTRHEAVSSDGERIPYTQTGPAGITGEAPVHLSAYGGFAISRLPTYNPTIGALWLERGGTSVVANIRGGGEFGTRWHEAGRRAGKALSHDDFAAVAADLVARGVTRPGRIAAEGGSNGGLLIANMLTRFPERFGALFCTIPLIDMRRYTRLLAGASWIAEYGDPDLPEDWAFMQHLSAYHNAVAGRPYPPILLATTRRDDRVHPGHARKMAAKLQALGYEAWFYEPPAGGHGYGKDNVEMAAFAALGMAFLRRSIGWL